MTPDEKRLIEPAQPLPGEFTPTAWIAPDKKLKIEEWFEICDAMSLASKAIHFWIGDLVNYGKSAYGEKYAQALDATKFAYGTLRNDAFCAARIPPDLRRRKLSHWHHYLVACFSDDLDVISYVLEKVIKKGWKSKHLQTILKRWQFVFGERNRLQVARPIERSATSILPLYVAPEDRPAPINWKRFATRFRKQYRHWRWRAEKAEDELTELKADYDDVLGQLISLQDGMIETEGSLFDNRLYQETE